MASPARNAVDDGSVAPLIDCIPSAIAGSIGHLPDGCDRFGIAVSGGPDSMALLDMMADAFPGRVEAATVDHGLRPASAAEAAMVAAWCAARGIAHAVLTPEAPITGSIQAAARTARYALLEQWRGERGLRWLVTAHHADDQVETMIMRLNRASGVAGLAGIRSRRGHLLRPLLSIRKAELEAYVEDYGVPCVVDPANVDPRFDRARVRAALRDADWLDPFAVTRSAAALAEAEAALDWSVARLVEAHVRWSGAVAVLETTDLPREYLRRLLIDIIARAAPDARSPRGEAVDRAISQLLRGRTVSVGACTVVGGPRWTVRPSPPRRRGSRRRGLGADGHCALP